MLVRQSTARTIIVGPILDSDGAAKTDEVVGSLKIHKNGGAAGALDGSATLTHSQTGYYLLALTANDLDTLGCAEITLNSGTNSMPPRALNVITADAWDALHHATNGSVRADAVKISGDSTAADNLEAACDNYSATRGLAGTALPDAAADAAGGLPISDAGGLDLDAKLANTNEITAARMGALTDWLDGGRLDLILDARASQASVDDMPTVAEFEARTLAAADYFVVSDYTEPPTVEEIADQVWDEILAGHADVGSTGAALSAAGGSGDPWSTALPGAYGAGTAGYILGTNLDATITSRHASGAAVAKSPATLAAADVTGNLPADVLEWNGSSDAVAIINAGGQDRPAMALGLGTIGAGVFEANSIGASVLADSAVAKIQNGLALTGEAQTAAQALAAYGDDHWIAADVSGIDAIVQAIQAQTDQLQFDAEGRVIALAQGIDLEGIEIPPPEIDEQAIADAVDATLSAAHGAGSWEGGESGGTGPYVLTITAQDADETPIPNVRVRIAQGADVLSGTTDGNGQVVLRASNLGAYTLDAARDGYQQTSAGTIEVEGSAGVVVVMELSPTTSTPTTAIRFRPSGSGESSKVQSSPPFIVSEKTTAVLTFTLNDETGQAIPLADISTLTLTLYDKATGDTINDRDEQDVLNANRVVVSSTGAVTWSLSPADNEIINPAVTSGTRDTGREKHVALFQWTWDDGEEASSVQIEINVRQVRGITSSSESSG